MVFVLRTRRLVLDDLKDDDLPEMKRIADDPLVMRYVLLPGLEGGDRVRELHARAIAESQRDPRMGYMLAAREPETRDFAGLAFLEIDPELRSTAEVGVLLSREYWADGHASEILGEFLAFGFTELSLHRIFGKCDELNVPSTKVMERCGLTYEGTLREHVWLRDHWRSSRYYGILAEEYRAMCGHKPSDSCEPGRSG
jgi:ribosomal-protein-alanine N-acetyltransferase